MKLWIALLAFLISLTSAGYLPAAEKSSYPPPRFPSYLKPPKISMADIMPYARAAVRYNGEGTLLGLVVERQYRADHCRLHGGSDGDAGDQAGL